MGGCGDTGSFGGRCLLLVSGSVCRGGGCSGDSVRWRIGIIGGGCR